MEGSIHRSWRQGSILPQDYLGKETDHLRLRSPLVEDDLVIVISHSCDVLNSSMDVEPQLEVLIGRRIDDSECTEVFANGRHLRKFHFRLAGKCYEVSSAEKSIVRRSVLLRGGAGILELPGKLVRLLAVWAARKYVRPALPDEFNRRCKPSERVFRKTLQQRGHLFTDIFLCLNTHEELGPVNPYDIELFFVVPTSFIGSPQEEEAIKIAAELESALARCEGIQVLETRIMPENKFSLEHVRNTIKLDFDFLSYNSDPDQASSARTI